MSQNRKYFPGISPRAWEHPADTAAIQSLEKIPAFKELIKFFLKFTSDKSLRLLYLANGVRVTEKQYPRVHKLVIEASKILDMEEVPETFVVYSPVMNATTLGVNTPIITLNSAIVSSLTDDELLGVIGHEIGHIKSGHVLYKTLMWLLVNFSTQLMPLPIAQLAIFPVVAALREWDRKSELSADRAELLVVQDPDVSYRTLMKLAGGNNIGEMDINQFLEQAAEYEGSGDAIDGVHKLLNVMWQTHPFPVIRLPEIKSWVDSGAYNKIYEGNYPHQKPEDDDLWKIWQKAGDSYKADMNKSNDPLVKGLNEVSKMFEKLGKNGSDLLSGIFNNGNDD
ncbi:M48 family metallopeptidase [Spirochaeta cellobiosiphila]|uniref:M48 family metallopeptidase n=1 Tax=Spirochaeta cellobiosiphila TaxID=504483 RepID=UPI0004259475|nr:M48 family metallopeptidase [Spirochaeta cellobiosiphila]